MRKLAQARVSNWGDFLISYRFFMLYVFSSSNDQHDDTILNWRKLRLLYRFQSTGRPISHRSAEVKLVREEDGIFTIFLLLFFGLRANIISSEQEQPCQVKMIQECLDHFTRPFGSYRKWKWTSVDREVWLAAGKSTGMVKEGACCLRPRLSGTKDHLPTRAGYPGRGYISL